MSGKLHLEDITNGQEQCKIPLINSFDGDGLPKNFQYTSCSSLGLGVETCTEDFESAPQPCTCIGACQISTCLCAITYEFAFLNFCLKADFASSHAKPVIECSSYCTCDSKCPNRVTQFGISCKLRVYKTKNKGFAVQTMDNIRQLSYVCDYAGEIIDEKEAKKRFLSQDVTDPNYIFVLREHCSENTIITTIVDPTITGNVGRFLNHSCSPNLIVVPVRNESLIPRLCFFAVRDILPLEELCYDYGTSDVSRTLDADASKFISGSQETVLKKCCCESENCSGSLPFCSDLFYS